MKSRATKRHYNDIINPYKEGDYETGRARLWECIPYFIGKYCTRKNMYLHENEYGGVMLYADEKLMAGKYNIDTIIQNAVNDCLRYISPISTTLYGWQKSPVSCISLDSGECYVSDGELRYELVQEEEVSAIGNLSYKIEEIRSIMLSYLTKEERYVIEARYFRDTPIQPFAIAKHFGFTRRKVDSLLRSGLSKLKKHLSNMVDDDND